MDALWNTVRVHTTTVLIGISSNQAVKLFYGYGRLPEYTKAYIISHDKLFSQLGCV